MQEYLQPLVDYIHHICTGKAVSCEGLEILTLEAVNVARLCFHRLTKGYFCPQVLPCHPHEVSCAVADLLVPGNHMDLLVQDLARLFLGELVLEHGEQELHFHGALLSIRRAC